MTPAPDPFVRLITALEPYLDQIVIIGGWAHQLYRQHPAAQQLDYPPLMTLDTDIAMLPGVALREQDIRSRLVAHGFEEEFLGDDRPPATHYRLGDEASGFYAEFLTPLVGAGRDRTGRRIATTEISGVTSQRLRYLEILLHHAWAIDFASGEVTERIRIANPVSFIAQKVLILARRDPEDRAKDILYMHDTLEVFGSRLAELRALWREFVLPELHANQAKVISKASEVLFGDLTDDVRRASQIAGQRVSPKTIRQACQYGFREVFEQATGPE
jgi:hypothetical protein